MKRVVILQPSYLPWLGYFDQMHKADTFVFFDDVQYTRRDWRNRNRIKLKSGEIKYITVPVKTKGKYDALIKDIEIDNDQDWAQSHVGVIKENYKNAQYFNDFFPRIQEVLLKQHKYLSDLDIESTKAIAELLGIRDTKFALSSDMEANYQSPTGHLVEICKKHNATHYLTGDSAKDYLEEDLFKEAGILLEYHGYTHPVYSQPGNEFTPYLSVIDLLFNEGGDSLEILSGNR